MLKTLLFSTALLLPAAAFAAPLGVTLTHDKAITTFHGAPGKQTLPKWTPPKGKIVIFDTLGSSYDDGSGYTISNPSSEADVLQWFAYAITPSTTTSVSEIAEAIGYVTGTDSVTIALLADNNGVPGTVLAEKTVKNLETFGDCCAVAVAKFHTGIPVTAGTTYWVGALLPSKRQSTTWDAWNFSTENTGSGPAAYYNTDGWNATDASYTAFAVYGK